MRQSLKPAIISIASIVSGQFAVAQNWVEFTNQTASRLSIDAALGVSDTEQKAYAWGDVDQDGDIDLVIARKIPFTFAGGRRNVLLINEGVADGHAINGVLVDRTAEYANLSINIPQSELDAAAALNPPLPGVSNGFLDLTNDHDIKLADVNNDGWLDIITATGESNVSNQGQPYMLPRFLGHPRVYINLGEVDGQWQGFVYDHDRIPQLLSKVGLPCNPRFSAVAVGDVTGDGFADLFFADHDSGEVGPDEPPSFDMDHRLLINVGEKNAGAFVDETLPRLAANYNYGGTVGTQNLAYGKFAMEAAIADMNGDGLNDLVKQVALTPPQHIAIIKNNPSDTAVFASSDYKVCYSLSAYYMSVGDLNNDGKLDLVMTDSNLDRYLLNTGNDANGHPQFTTMQVTFGAGSDDGFGGNSVIADLNNDGWNDALITDVDPDGFGCSRRMHIYHNLANPPSITLKEESPTVIPFNQLQGTHDVAVFDLNSDGWKDLVIGRCNTMSVWMNTPPCPADNSPLGGNGIVDVDDLLSVINNWAGTTGPADISGNGTIDVDDLLAVINGWGPCQ